MLPKDLMTAGGNDLRKKIITVLTALSLCASLAGCGREPQDTGVTEKLTEAVTTEGTSDTAESTEDITSEAETSSGKFLPDTTSIDRTKTGTGYGVLRFCPGHEDRRKSRQYI